MPVRPAPPANMPAHENSSPAADQDTVAALMGTSLASYGPGQLVASVQSYVETASSTDPADLPGAAASGVTVAELVSEVGPLPPAANNRIVVRNTEYRSMVLGGCERVVGGWTDHEADRRQSSSTPAAKDYPGRKYIGGMDAAASLLSSALGDSEVVGGDEGRAPKTDHSSTYASRALRRFNAAIQRIEGDASLPQWWEANSAISLPPNPLPAIIHQSSHEGHISPENLVTSVKLAESIAKSFVADGATNPTELSENASTNALAFVEEAKKLRQPLLDLDSVPVKDRKKVRELESKCRSYAAAVEECTAQVVKYIEQITAALESKFV